MVNLIAQINPYIIGHPITDPKLFFGRENLFQFIEDNLKQDTKVILLHGQRRIGKTSVLCQIPNFVAQDEFIFVLFDLQDKGNLPLNVILQDLAEKIVDQVCNRLNISTSLPQIPIIDKTNTFSDIFLPIIQELIGNRKLVLLLDEFDVLGDYSPDTAGEHFFPYLKAILTKHPKLVIIPVLGRQLQDLSTLISLFREAPNQKIGLLDDSSAIRLITKPVEGLLEYHSDAIRAILELSAGHPYFTQVICFALFGRARSTQKWHLVRADVESVIDKALEIGTGGLTWFQNGLPPTERVVFSAVAEAQEIAIKSNASFIKEPSAILQEHGVILTEALLQAEEQLLRAGFVELANFEESSKVNTTTYKVKIEFVRRWLLKRYSLSEQIWELQELNADAQQLYAQASEKLQNDEISNALKLYENALELNPNHFSALFALAELYLNLQEFLRAQEFYSRAYQVDPVRARDGLFQSLLGYGRELILQEQFDLAQETIDKALTLHQENSEVQALQLLLLKTRRDSDTNHLINKILILATNPITSSPLRLEVREISQGLRRSKNREQFEIISRWAVRPRDIQRAILEFQPHIVHFIGHSTSEGGIVLEDETGHVRPVNIAALANIFELFKEQVECVLLNASYSESQAMAVAQHIRYVIGIPQAISDKAAIEFAVSFYDALGAGESIEFAYQIGINAIALAGIPERLMPVLIKQKEQKEEINYYSSIPESSVNGTTKIISLEIPEGQLPLDFPLYVERPPIESICYEEIVKPGALIRVKGPRQMGKSSLMARILHKASQQGCLTVSLSFQLADRKVFTDLEKFLQWFCASVGRSLKMPNKLADYWDDILGSKYSCTAYFEEYLLAEINQPLVLALDEVDRIFQSPEIADDFLGMLRSWYEMSNTSKTWQKLRLVITYSQEIYFVLNINQSPFNVGRAVELPEFTQAQVHDLVQRYDLNWTGDRVERLMQMVGGHPYLVQLSLYHIKKSKITLEELLELAPTEEGIYTNHLRRHLLNLKTNPSVSAAFSKVVVADSPVRIEPEFAYKLNSMGLVKFTGNDVIPFCNLYRLYFRDLLSG
jgi:tetratricopeptide (TPR) repeat protein